MSVNQPDLKKENKLDFVVMPDLAGGGPPSGSSKNLMRATPGSRRKSVLIILMIVLGLAILGALAYYFFVMSDSEDVANMTPDIVVGTKDESKEDPDNDGLTNEEEGIQGTKKDNSDTDNDGLADGDEIAVYGSNPRLADSDGDSFNDGQEIARGFSPAVKSTEKADAAERQKWLHASTEVGLHEPTITTLKAVLPAEEQEAVEAKTLFVDSFYNYSIEYPGVLSVREEGNGQIVGISIAGSEPADDIALEQFVIALAGTKDALTLKEWVQTQFSAEEYTLEELSVNNMPAIRLRGRPSSDGECGNDKTFFAKNNLIISVTWNCNTLAPLGPLYTGIINSFKFR